MSDAVVRLKMRGFGETQRRDAWWSQPLVVFLALGAFLVYANLRVLEGTNYYSGHAAANAATNYLTPFYSPLMFDTPGHTPSGHAWMSTKPAWMPTWLSAAALILVFPAGFRFTCYYYRGAYYKAFWADPPNCAVGEPGFRGTAYRGEAKWPLLIQNIHRYFMYFAVAFLFILAWDAWHGMWFNKGTAAQPDWHFGFGLGSLMLWGNPILLGGYTLGCHSFRHLIGGRKDCVSDSPMGGKLYQCVSCLNSRHMLWAWMSLIWVASTDIYVRMLANGTWTDPYFTL